MGLQSLNYLPMDNQIEMLLSRDVWREAIEKAFLLNCLGDRSSFHKRTYLLSVG